MSIRSHWARIAGLLVVAAIICLLPSVLGSFVIILFTQGFIYAIAASSLDVVWGYTGILDLGHGLWFGIGAFTVGAVTTTLQQGLVVSYHTGLGRDLLGLLIGVAVTIVVAYAVGKFALTRKAPTVFFISIITLTLSTAVEAFYGKFSDFTGGDSGLYGFNYRGFTTTGWYFVAAVVAIIVMLALRVLVRSDFGALMAATRDSEKRLRYLGGHVELIRRSVFILGASISALAGAFYGAAVGLSSSSLFDFIFATQIVIWVAVGGRRTIYGPALGAIVLTVLTNELGSISPTQSELIEGLLFILVIVVIPDGLFPQLLRLRRFLPDHTREAPGLRQLQLQPTEAAATLLDAEAGAEADALSAPPPADDSDWLIKAKDLHFGYGDLAVLRGIDLTVRRGELLCLVGPNGAGKSTLMAVLSGAEKPASGSLSYRLGKLESEGSAYPEHLARAGLLRKFQVPEMFESLTPADSLLCAGLNGRRASVVRRTRQVQISPVVEEICRATGVLNHLDQTCASLPHGVKQGLDIALAVNARPELLLLDEPTAGLSHNERFVVGTLLRRLVDEGITCVLIEHDMDFVTEIADRLVVLADGGVVEDGVPALVRESPAVREVYLGEVGV
jgi:branched-chain amino acid transport system permease protein